MPLTTKARFSALVVLLVTLTVLVIWRASEIPVESASASTVTAKPELPNIFDEDPVSAKLPLAKVLDLDYEHDINAYTIFDNVLSSRLRHRQFEDIDAFAEQLRNSKIAFPGGRWRLARIYDAVIAGSQATASREGTTPPMALLDEWMRSYPNSITAPVAYGQAMVSYAFQARGSDAASKVSEHQWNMFNERLKQTHAAMSKAYSLPRRCPHFYAVMQQIASAESWDRKNYDRLFDEAVAFEPLYPNYYSLRANYLLPRWYGNEGEWQQFLIASTDRLDSHNGPAMFYYAYKFLADTTTDFTFEERDFPSIMRPLWPRVSRGFSEMTMLHGVSNPAINQFAKWAQLMGDREEAKKAFIRISEHWDKMVWKSRKNFDDAQMWAFQ